MIIQGNLKNKLVLVKGLDKTEIYRIKKEYQNGEVLYNNGNLGRVEDIIKVIRELDEG